jgi:hypothetical protein
MKPTWAAIPRVGGWLAQLVRTGTDQHSFVQFANRPACGFREQTWDECVDPASETRAHDFYTECKCDPQVLSVCLPYRAGVIQEPTSEHLWAFLTRGSATVRPPFSNFIAFYGGEWQIFGI